MLLPAHTFAYAPCMLIGTLLHTAHCLESVYDDVYYYDKDKRWDSTAKESDEYDDGMYGLYDGYVPRDTPVLPRARQGTQQSISRSILYTTKNALPRILSHEFNDVSQDLNRRLTSSIYNVRNSNIDHDKYRELIVIKKRVVSDGRHKVVNLDVSGRVVPRSGREEKVRMVLAGAIFLLAGVVFTGSLKFYQHYLRIRKADRKY